LEEGTFYSDVEGTPPTRYETLVVDMRH
jgi:hypothetical protein